jgi:Zn finger protein HypA/HybF involved in hydrogenase expression
MSDLIGWCVRCQEYQALESQGFICPVCRDIARQEQRAALSRLSKRRSGGQ